MKKRAVCGLVLFSLALAGCGAEGSPLESTRPTPGENIYTSGIAAEDCCLCGDGAETAFAAYWGQDNVGIVSFNTFDIVPIEINRYGPDGTLLKERTGCLSSQSFRAWEDGFEGYILADVDRGYATGTVSLYGDETLDVEKAASFLCGDCLNEVMADYQEGGFGAGIIHLKTGEWFVLRERCTGFGLDDFYISCGFPEKSADGDTRTVNLMIFYAPPRYES